jgi:hypothetical protein
MKERIGDFFTKPLQGALFYTLRAHDLNLSPDGVLPVSSTFASPQECIGDKVGDYWLPAYCSSPAEDPPTETPVGCKSSNN